MKQYTLFCIGFLFSWVAYTQEFKFYLNGSQVEDSAFIQDFQKGDLMRVVFSGKNTPHKFRIATVLVTLIPKGTSNDEVLNSPTGFVLDNTTNEFSNYPSFTFELFDRLSLLKHNDYDMAIKVNQLFADTNEGMNWIQNNVTFKAITIQKRNKTMANK